MTSLYIDRRGIELESDGEALIFRENGERIGTVPLAPVSRVYLRGDVQLQTSLLGKLGERGIGVIILSGRKAEPTLLMARPHNDAARRIAQYQRSLDAEFCLGYARKLVRRKILAQREFAAGHREHDLEHRYQLTLVLRKLDALLQQLDEKTSIPSLRGAEGAASSAHFESLGAIAPPRLNFHQRNRRPPRDPLNAILSLGYTMLHAEAVLALYGAGLDPFIGFYHQLDFGRESLACDVIEPMRVEIDQFALELFRKDELRIEDFTTSGSGCMLGKHGRARFYAAWDSLAERLRKQLAEQVEGIAAAIIPETGAAQHADDEAF